MDCQARLSPGRLCPCTEYSGRTLRRSTCRGCGHSHAEHGHSGATRGTPTGAYVEYDTVNLCVIVGETTGLRPGAEFAMQLGASGDKRFFGMEGTLSQDQIFFARDTVSLSLVGGFRNRALKLTMADFKPLERSNAGGADLRNAMREVRWQPRRGVSVTLFLGVGSARASDGAWTLMGDDDYCLAERVASSRITERVRMWLVIRDHRRCLRAAIQHGNDDWNVEAATEDEALLALEHGRTGMLFRIVPARVPVSSALVFRACELGRVDELQHMLADDAGGAAAHALDSEGRTALHVALQHAQEHVAYVLLSFGVAPGSVDAHGGTALSYAEAAGLPHVVAKLRALGQIPPSVATPGPQLGSESESESEADADDEYLYTEEEEEQEHEQEEAQGEAVEALCRDVGEALAISADAAEALLLAAHWDVGAALQSFEPAAAPRVDSVESAGQEELCATCYCPADEGEALQGPGCGHRMCGECWRACLKTALEAGQALTATCPFCPAPLSARNWAALAAPEDAQRRAQLLVSSFVAAQSDIARCRNGACARLVRAPAGGGSDADCPGCGWTVCVACGNEAHAPVVCQGLQRWQDEATTKTDFESLRVMLTSFKRCPSCRSLIEKNLGCRHMSCPCGHQFCWLCSGDWRGHRSCGNSERNPMEWNGVDDESKLNDAVMAELRDSPTLAPGVGAAFTEAFAAVARLGNRANELAAVAAKSGDDGRAPALREVAATFSVLRNTRVVEYLAPDAASVVSAGGLDQFSLRELERRGEWLAKMLAADRPNLAAVGAHAKALASLRAAVLEGMAARF